MRLPLYIAGLLPCLSFAQVPHATLDTTILRVGEQATLVLAVDLDANRPAASIDWPLIEDPLNDHVEVVMVGDIDTVVTPMANIPDVIQLVREVKITSFDTGFWAIPPFEFIIDGERSATEAMLLEVRTVDLGEHPELRDIKDIHDVPFSLLEWLRTNWYWLLLPLVVAGIIWTIHKKWKARPLEKQQVVAAPVPVHQRILQQLRALENERLWQKGEHKAYHSRLTDLLRAYLEERYRVPALERTTDELLHELRISSIGRDHLMQLRNMLELSDMVKFAKAVPTPIENEQMMQGAISFVEETAPQNTATIHA